MISETIEKILKARSNVNLDFNEMLDVKKYMFGELIKTRLTDEAQIKSDIEYVDSLNNFDPHNCDMDKISKEGLKLVYKLFAGYISIVSTKRCEEDLVMTKPVCENESGFEKYEVNASKKMYIRYKAQTADLKQQNTIEMVRQLYTTLDAFGENYYVFKLSDNRALLLVNTFFRLYFDNYAERRLFADLNIANFSDIPSFMCFVPNGVLFKETRVYKYEIHELDLDTAEYFNSLC